MIHLVATFLVSHAMSMFLWQWWESTMLWIVYICAILTGMCALWYKCSTHKIVAYLACICLGMTLSAASVYRFLQHESRTNTLGAICFAKSCTMTGTIIDEPDVRPLEIKYTIAIQQAEEDPNLQGTILVTDTRMWPRFFYGDTVTVYGTLQIPIPKTEDTFSYASYLRRFGITAIIPRGKIETVTAQHYTWIDHMWRTLFAIKSRFELQINRQFAEPHASFLAGILTGSRKGIPEQTLQAFQTTGLTHIIAISGFNITIIIVLMNSILRVLPSRWRLLPSVLAIVCFTIFVGASAAVVRAAIMGSLGLLALHSQRQSAAIITVLWTHFFMTSYNPTMQWYDAGFQLSFLSVLGLIAFVPMLTPYMQWAPETLAIRESICMTIAAQITTMPLIIISFQQMSLVSVLANVAIAPSIPIAMALGFTGTMLSFVVFPIGHIINYYTWWCLEYVIQVATHLSHIPYATVEITSATWLSGGLYYIGVLCLVLYYNKRVASVE